MEELNTNINDYSIPKKWFDPSLGEKCFYITSFEIDLVDPAFLYINI